MFRNSIFVVVFYKQEFKIGSEYDELFNFKEEKLKSPKFYAAFGIWSWAMKSQPPDRRSSPITLGLICFYIIVSSKIDEILCSRWYLTKN